jgi:hypothetical protein
MVLTAANIKLEVFCNVSPYSVAGATIVTGFVACILTFETEVANSSETFVCVEQLHGVIFYKSLIQILFGSKTSLYLGGTVHERVQLCMNCRLLCATFLWLYVHWCFFEFYRDRTTSSGLRVRTAWDNEIFTSDLYETWETWMYVRGTNIFPHSHHCVIVGLCLHSLTQFIWRLLCVHIMHTDCVLIRGVK